MAFSISSKNNEKTFNDKTMINISSKQNADYFLNTGFEFMLTVQYDIKSNKCTIFNQFNNPNFLFKGQPLPQKLEIEKVCKIMINGSDEYITIKILENTISNSNPHTTSATNISNKQLSKEQLTENDLKAIYGNDINAAVKLKVEQRKSELDVARVAILKQVGGKINDLKRKISMNSKAGILLHIASFLASFVCAFGISNYLTGLPLQEADGVIQMPSNLKLILIYAIIVFGIGSTLKQGMFLYMQNRLGHNNQASYAAERIMIVLSSIFYVAIYFINMLYYMAPKSFPLFAIFISLFFTGVAATMAMACGYFKSNSVELRKELVEYEYREDFEHVIKEYQQWIERFVNTLNIPKLQSVKDKLGNLQIKSLGETILGIFTAPFLAYGVSNTLASCFPEAAGWVRISGLRLSPIFLVLATFLIIFAFFNFVNGFFCNKKVQASNVLKQDGYSNYAQHGVDIYGLEGVKKLDTEMRRSFIIGLSIIFIEFSMNVSFFMQSIGGDLGGLLLSGVTALVPTALLIAETFMLSSTKFEIYTCESLIAKNDRI